MKKNIILTLPLLFPTLVTAATQQYDCITEAAMCFQINPLLIKAIIFQESGNRQHAITKNKNNTIDIGLMQINSIHLKELSSIGISEKKLRENSCVNVFSGSWILYKTIQKHGYSWDGIGKYHSSTPHHHDKYINKIISIIVNNDKALDNIQVYSQEEVHKKFKCK
ncbi:lytic transglycosylase domain-containing protein [Pectobacterium brasiliense]|uniref:lytic transglycosylase domain-containing protein n=1 Tax=Pectobacterium brasiliense TaxID=180957 RepID=UPI001968DA5F|nr:lytic transglycosylase domain-containing protein [Pectobacterium brasiliense]MBN3264693.1 lytic transglycosylase domain-containing protein [Pectobacterium brasiliense]